MNAYEHEKTESVSQEDSIFGTNRQVICHRGFIPGMMVGVWRIKYRVLLPIVLVLVLFNINTIAPLQAQHDQTVGKSRLTISKETTYITHPLRKDGSVDYVAALNQRFSQGVTPENNSAVLFWKAVGPEEILPQYRKKYFQMLGISPLPEKGDYFVDLYKYMVRQKIIPQDSQQDEEIHYRVWKPLDTATSRPWSPQEFPVLAQWLSANKEQLALIVEASKRPRCYDPLCCGQEIPLIAIHFPALCHFREVTGALHVRAMLRLNEGKVEEAWKDLLACHKLARLAGQGPTMVHAFIAFAIESSNCTVDQKLLQHTHLNAIQAAKMQDDLKSLPTMPKMVDKLDVAERFEYLDMVSVFSRDGLASIAGYEEVLGGKEFTNIFKLLVRLSRKAEINWDLILREANSWFDRLVDASRQPIRAVRQESLGKLEEDFSVLKQKAVDVKIFAKEMIGNPREALSERLSQVLLSIFFPDYVTHFSVYNRTIMQFELDKLSFALAAYHADHDAYPAKFADLTPKYVAEVPKDIFNDSDLHYILEGKGYLLYSVGINGKDDDAKSCYDRKEEEDWDDLVVRVPAPTQK